MLQTWVRVKQRIHSPLFAPLFRRISVLHITSRRGGCYVLYVSGALRRMDTLFYPGPTNIFKLILKLENHFHPNKDNVGDFLLPPLVYTNRKLIVSRLQMEVKVIF
jgi:hypothetical protein